VKVELRRGVKPPVDVASLADQESATLARETTVDAAVPMALSGGTCGSTWHPNSVKVVAKPAAQPAQRYAQVLFKWTTSARLANLHACPSVTFEADFVTYNYDDAQYLGMTIYSYSSNMPSYYHDTPASDSSDELNYSLGTTDAKQLQLNTEYFTYFRTNHGNASSDTVKVVAQRGKRTPSGCHNAWCIFAQASIRYPTSGWITVPTNGITVYK
jgi:hypothetical protein